MEKDLDATPTGAGISLPGTPVPQNREQRQGPVRGSKPARWPDGHVGGHVSSPATSLGAGSAEVPLGCQPRRLQSMRGLLGPGARAVRLL